MITVADALQALGRGVQSNELTAHYVGRRVMISSNGAVLLTLPCEETPPCDLAVGMTVLVFGLHDEAITARVEEIRRREDTPGLLALNDSAVTRGVMMSYRYNVEELVFQALEIGGKWWDVRRKRLDFERIGPV